MASFLIHLCICDEVNKEINKDKNKILIGSIAPDIAKLVGINRDITHFGKYPVFNEDMFLDKYKDKLNDDFVLGYFIHLYSDYLWDKYFINKIYNNGVLTMIDGTQINFDGNICDYLYKDYDSLIEEIISNYNLDLAFLNEKIPNIDNIIEEIPMDRLNIVVDKAYELVSNKYNKNKLYVMDINMIKEFILLCKNQIINKIKEITQ